MARGRYSSNGNAGIETEKVRLNKDSLREGLMVFRYLRPYRSRFVIGLMLIALNSGANMAFPYLLKKLIDTGIKPGHTFLETPNGIALLMSTILLLFMFSSFFRTIIFSYVGEHAVADMRREIYEKLIQMPMEFFAQRRVGELSSRVTADVSQIQDTITTLFAQIIRNTLILIIGIGLILYISVRLTLLMLSIVPLVIIIALIYGRKIRRLAREAQDELADSNTVVQETLQGITNVKAFSNEWFEMNRYTRSINKVVRLAIRNSKYTGLFSSFLLFSFFGSTILVVWYGANMLHAGQLTFGDLTAFVLYTAFVGGTFAAFADVVSQVQKTIGATQRIREILSEVAENVSVKPIELQEQFRLSGNVSLQNISFSYPSRKDIQVLKNVSVSAQSGQQIAIVGPSGAGKSSLAAILLGFYQPQGGHILFDGRDAGAIPIAQRRLQMAMVPQDVLLFGGTIRENIAYGKPEATYAAIEEAARQANAHDFIMGFPEGYETVVGERGMKLSGGQRQRIAIARAILKDPVILILDEATSSLDSESEALVQQALNNLMQNRTSFVIAHRLSTIRNADLIVVLEHGQVIEAGTHQELMQLTDGLYRNMTRLQVEFE